MKYIAYGSNMVNDQMKFRCPDSKLIGTGYIENARLEFFLHATVVKCSKEDLNPSRVPVAVWEISERDLASLDRYEGFPTYYTKSIWNVTMSDGSQIKGLIYLMRMIRHSPPTQFYFDAIADAYKQLGFRSEIGKVLHPALIRSLYRFKNPECTDLNIIVTELSDGFYVLGVDDEYLYSVDNNAIIYGSMKLPVEEIKDENVIREFGLRFLERNLAENYASCFGIYTNFQQLPVAAE